MEEREKKNNTLKIVLITLLIVFVAVPVFIIGGLMLLGLIFGVNNSSTENITQEQIIQPQAENGTQEQGTETIKDNEQETQPQAEINNNQTENGGARGDILKYNWLSKELESNLSVNSEGEGVFIEYDYNGQKEKVWEGTFKGSKLYGEGRLSEYFTLGDTLYKIRELKGTFINSSLNGQGEIIKFYRDGEVTERRKGTFKNGKLNGEGVFIEYNILNGEKRTERKGTFKDGLLHGEGTLIKYSFSSFLEDEIKKGTFEDGILISD